MEVLFYLANIIGYIFIFIYLFFISKLWVNTSSTFLLIGYLRFILLYRIIAYGIIPNTLRFINYGLNYAQPRYDVTAFELFTISSMEIISDLIFISALTLLLNLFRVKLNTKVSDKINNRVVVIIILFGTFLLFYKESLISYLWLIIPFILKMAPALSVYLLHKGFLEKRKQHIIIGFTGIICFALFTLLSGHRGMIVTLLILNLYFFWTYPVIKRSRIIAIATFLFVGFLAAQEPVKAIKQISIRTKIERKHIGKSYSMLEKFKVLSEYNANNNNEELTAIGSITEIIQEIQFRFGAPSMYSVGFLRLYNKGQSAGLNPIINSFYSFLPRQLIGNDKPWPSSVDGTKHGMGMYKTVNEISGKISTMVDFSVPAHYYWEFGWLGVVFLSLIPALYIVILLRMVESLKGIGFGIFFLGLKSFQILPKLWISEIITMTATVLLPSFVILVLFIFINRIRLKTPVRLA